MEIFIISIAIVVFFMGHSIGSSRQGRLTKITNNLPNGVMVIMTSDKTSTVLEDVSTGKRYLVSTEVFGGKPVRPKNLVRKIKNNKERKELGIPVIGYPPLIVIKDVF